MSRNWFTFDGVSSLDFGVYLSATPEVYNAASRRTDTYNVPGGDGDIILAAQKGFDSVNIDYEGFIADDMRENLRDFLSYLSSKSSFCRLEDSYNPDEYRMAVLLKKPELAIQKFNEVMSFRISFTAKPQRWLKTGENEIAISSGSTGTILTNPTYFASYPIYIVSGAGNLVVNDETITVKANEMNQIFINSATQNAYSDQKVNASKYVDYVIYPSLHSGKNVVSYTGFTSVSVIPNWQRR